VGASGGKDSTTLLLNSPIDVVRQESILTWSHSYSKRFRGNGARVFIKELEKQLSIPFYYLDIAIQGRVQKVSNSIVTGVPRNALGTARIRPNQWIQ
jgi:7-cyano-7-deazaguanine synthase in queuosine biosynthesis